MKIFLNTVITIFLIIALLAFALTLAGYRFKSLYERDSLSMSPTISKGDYFLVDIDYEPKNIKRGDLVLIDDYRYNYTLARRIIGIENDKIEIVSGGIYLNGKKLDEPYANAVGELNEKSNENYLIQYVPQKIIPKGKFYVAGDNRINAIDSRNDDFGLIALKEIRGKIKVIIFSRSIRKIGKTF